MKTVQLHLDEQDTLDLIADLKGALKLARRSAAHRTVWRQGKDGRVFMYVDVPLVDCIDCCLKEDSSYG